MQPRYGFMSRKSSNATFGVLLYRRAKVRFDLQKVFSRVEPHPDTIWDLPVLPICRIGDFFES